MLAGNGRQLLFGNKSLVRLAWVLAAVAVLVLAALSVAFWPKLVSRGYVQMGSIELSKGQAAVGVNAEQGDRHLQLAESYFQRALNWNAGDASINVKLGITYLAAGHTQRALEYLSRAKGQSHDDRLGSLWLGVAYFRAGRNQLASDLFREAGAMGQLLLMGNQYARSDDYTDAAAAYRAAISVRPDSAQTYRKLGQMEEASGNMNEAIDAYTSYLSLEKTDLIQKYLVEAHIADVEKRWLDAVTAYERAFALVSKDQSTFASTPAEQQEGSNVRNDPELHIRLGMDYGELGWRDDSIREFQEGVRLGATSKWNLRALADAYFEKGDFQSSLTWYRKVLEVDPTDWRATERLQALGAAR